MSKIEELESMEEVDHKFALRVWFMADYIEGWDAEGETQECSVTLTPSSKLPGEGIVVTREGLPEFITQPIAMLKMLRDGERIKFVGKRVSKDLFYVYVLVEDWLQYMDDKTEEK